MKYRLNTDVASDEVTFLAGGEWTQEKIMSFFEPIEEKEECGCVCHCKLFCLDECNHSTTCEHCQKPQQIEKLDFNYHHEIDIIEAIGKLGEKIDQIINAWNKEHHD